jgi:hypothetical protein
MLKKLTTTSYEIYEVEQREPTDDNYLAVKIWKDRQKLRRWLIGLMNDREVILTWRDSGQEVTAVATRKLGKYDIAPVLPSDDDMPKIKDIVNREEVEEIRHVAFYSMPDKQIIAVYLDDISHFIVSNEGLQELTDKLVAEEPVISV